MTASDHEGCGTVAISGRPAQRAGAGDAAVPPHRLCGCRFTRASTAAQGIAAQPGTHSAHSGCLHTQTQQQQQQQQQDDEPQQQFDPPASGPGASPTLHSHLHGTGAPSGRPPSCRPACRQRSATPEDEQSMLHDQLAGPITPTAPATLAPVSPTAASGASLPPVGAGTGCSTAAASTATAAAATRAATAAAQWRCCQAFMHCVAASPLVQSALLSLELGGTHPGGEQANAAHAVRWTLAQLLAMHMNAGCMAASEASVLAALWLLESVESAWRSPATVCLSDYVKHLAVFSPEAVLEITADWRASFCRLRQSVVDAQMDLLTRLDWRLYLDAATEVHPCHALLFTLPSQSPAGRPHAACNSCPEPGSARELWAARMHRVCEAVQHRAQAIGSQAGAASACTTDLCSEEFENSPIKRQCIRA